MFITWIRIQCIQGPDPVDPVYPRFGSSVSRVRIQCIQGPDPVYPGSGSSVSRVRIQCIQGPDPVYPGSGSSVSRVRIQCVKGPDPVYPGYRIRVKMKWILSTAYASMYQPKGGGRGVGVQISTSSTWEVGVHEYPEFVSPRG